ncbi:MAG TPA: DUF4954 family protein [Chitinivibrionales bacterium]|nr:DUF4954 family protein [Chitinivibrionales bacterium]
MDDIKTLTAGILEKSEFLNAVRPLKQGKTKSRLFGDAVRHLSEDEISRLKAQGNRAADWHLILVAEAFRPGGVTDSAFFGVCVLGAFDGRPVAADASLAIPCGIYKSVIVESEIGNNCLVYDVSMARYLVLDQAVVHRVGALVCTGTCTFGNGLDIPVGIETGGREVQSFADMTMTAAQAIAARRSDRQLQSGYRDFVKAYAEAAASAFGIAGPGCVIRNTPRVADTFAGPGCFIDGATLVENATIMCTPQEKALIGGGAFVRNSCVQWGCEITSMAIVDDSVLTEHSRVERHAKVTKSIIGPNTEIAEGEVTACLVGPFVGLHHQALLIAALWPEGKGNVAAGANVGSNHTARAPDQELWCGEGTFIGLGANIKFPSDFSRAPYGIIATGVTTLPQRMEFPFSLINKPSAAPAGAPQSLNELIPGWVLSDNLYAVKRNESKFLKRNKAKRGAFACDTLRPDTIDLIVSARDRLKNAAPAREWYGPADINGLGENFMTEESRKKGVATYDFYIEYYCLCGLAGRLAGGAAAVSVFRDATKDPVWEHQRGLCGKEGLAKRGVKENLTRLFQMHEKVAADTKKAKQKDDERGRRVIADYDAAHTQAKDDLFVKETTDKIKKMKAELEQIIAKL